MEKPLEDQPKLTELKPASATTAQSQPRPSTISLNPRSSKPQQDHNAAIILPVPIPIPIPNPKHSESHGPPVDPTKKLFRRFLDKSGLKDAIIRSIVSLYEEEFKPDDPIGYMSRFLGLGIPTDEKIHQYEVRADKLRHKLEVAKEENTKLRDMYETKKQEHRRMVQIQDRCHQKKLKLKQSKTRRVIAKAKSKAHEEARKVAHKSPLQLLHEEHAAGHTMKGHHEKLVVMKVKVPTMLVHRPITTSQLRLQQQPVLFANVHRQTKSAISPVVPPTPKKSTIEMTASDTQLVADQVPVPTTSSIVVVSAQKVHSKGKSKRS